MSKVIRRTYPRGSYTWDAGNRLSQVVDSIAGTITLGHDALDRLESEATPNGTVAYTYDAVGRRLTMDVPGQAQIAYAWDNADRLQTITQGANVVTFDYDNANRRTKLTYPSGTSTEYAYDTASRLTGLTYTHGGNTLGALTYAYDAASQRVQVGGSWARTGLPAALASATYNAANHQTAVGGQALTYDLSGNLTGDGTTTYTWNARNQLASISGPIAGSFVYDAFGRRQRTTLDGVITDVVYDGLNPVRQAVGATTVNLLTGLGIDEYLTRADSSGSRDLLSDALGSTVSLSETGTLQTEYSYEPFGAVTASGSSSANEFRYTGREDDGTGLYYYRARYYHPGLQRFISEDPIGFLGRDVNLYAYVFNNPASYVDPSGLGKIGTSIKIIKRIGNWLRESRQATLKQAQNARRRGADVEASSRRTARQIKEGAFRKDPNAGELIEHGPHRPGYRPHFQTQGKPGHTFFRLAIPGAGLGSMVRRKTGSELLGDAVDFLNPLSDVQDLVDLFEYWAEAQDRDEWLRVDWIMP